MMISSRTRSFFTVLSIASFLGLSYLSWTLSSKIAGHPPLHAALIVTAISGFNLTILSGWIGLGALGGAVITISALFFTLLLGFRMGYYGYNIFTLAFLATAFIGYLFTRAKNRLDQLYVLKSEKDEEEINVLANEIKEKNKSIKALEEKLMRYSTLKEVTESLSTALSLDGITELIIEKTLKTLGKSGMILLFLVDTNKQELTLSASSVKDYPVIRTKRGDVFDHWVLRHRKSLIIEDVAKDFRFPTEGIEQASGVFRSIIATPLLSENKVIGVLRMDSPREFFYVQDDLRLLDIIANLGAVAIQNSMLYSRIQELAIKDSLTGLKVRRFFMERFHREVRRAARKREPLSLLILDIDHFKEYNDKYGHASGDLILKYLAETINVLLEEADVASRYGGEEIAILLWRKGKKEAILQAEKLRQMIKERPLALRNQETNITVSIGVSTYPEDAISEEELIRVADARLYKAKAEGRDRVCSV